MVFAFDKKSQVDLINLLTTYLPTALVGSVLDRIDIGSDLKMSFNGVVIGIIVVDDTVTVAITEG